MTTFYVSFTVESRLKDHYTTVEADNEEDARALIFSMFGRTDWYTVTERKSDIYTENRGVTHIPLAEAFALLHPRRTFTRSRPRCRVPSRQGPRRVVCLHAWSDPRATARHRTEGEAMSAPRWKNPSGELLANAVAGVKTCLVAAVLVALVVELL